MEIKKIGIIGRPLGYSVAPVMYGELFAKGGFTADYVRFDIGEAEVPEAILQMQNAGFSGFNITMPYKVLVTRYLDRLEPSAQRIGAVNLVRFEGAERVGDNTDGAGFVRALKYRGFEVDGARITLLGAGGAAMAIAFAFGEGGASHITIVNRTRAHAEALSDRLNTALGRVAATASDAIDPKAALIVNATRVGMYPDTGNPLEGFTPKEGTLVADAVYKPYKTPMIRYAESLGLRGMPGLDMLFFQGWTSCERWLGHPLNLEADEIAHILDTLRDRLEELMRA